MLENIYVGLSFVLAAWFGWWCFRNDRLPPGERNKGLFAILDSEEFRRKYGDKRPF